MRVELVAAGPALLESGDQRVDQPLGVTQLGRGHPVELPVAQHLAARVGVRGDDDALDLGVVIRVVLAGRWDRDASLVGAGVDALLAGGGLRLTGRLALEVPLVAGSLQRWGAGSRRPVAGAVATSGRTRRRRLGRSSRRRTKTASPAARTCSRSPMSTSGKARA